MSRDPNLCRRAGDEWKCSGGGTNLRRRSRRHKSQELKVSKAAETDAVSPAQGCSQFDLNIFITEVLVRHTDRVGTILRTVPLFPGTFYYFCHTKAAAPVGEVLVFCFGECLSPKHQTLLL